MIDSLRASNYNIYIAHPTDNEKLIVANGYTMEMEAINKNTASFIKRKRLNCLPETNIALFIK